MDTFRPQNTSEPFLLRVNECVSLSFYPASQQLEHRFVLGGYSDHEAGGWVVAELIKSMRFFVAEKSRKVVGYHFNYQEWWLVMVDMTGLNFSPEDFTQGRPHFPDKGLWSKIVLLDRSCTSTLVEI